MFTNMKKIILTTIYYPFIFASIPIISIYLGNIEFVDFSEFLLITIVSILILIPVWLVLYKTTGSINKSGLISAIFFLLFYSFGSFLRILADVLYNFGLDVRLQMFTDIGWKLNLLLVIWIALFLGFSLFIYKIKGDLELITTFMNITSLILLVLTIIKYSSNVQKFSLSNQTSDFNTISIPEDRILTNNQFPNHELPNIYFIVLDGYGRRDTLKDIYAYDNKEIEDFLISNGFFIAEKSYSNYLQTYLSLASNLNISYLDVIAEHMDPNSNNTVPILNHFQNNRVMEFLNNHGYKIIAFETGYFATELSHLDHYYSTTWTLSEFTNGIINLTPLQIWIDELQNDNHRKRIHYTFSQLPKIIDTDKPTFVFAHVVAPHPPFVFGSNGESINQDRIFTIDENLIVDTTYRSEYAISYPDQVIYINSLLKKSVENILSNSGGNSIIVIQGDHGPRSMWDANNIENTNINEVFPILNAFYFPDQDYSNLYDNISSVNTFRVKFDQYFGTTLGLLDDRSFYTSVSTPYRYIDVTEPLIGE